MSVPAASEALHDLLRSLWAWDLSAEPPCPSVPAPLIVELRRQPAIVYADAEGEPPSHWLVSIVYLTALKQGCCGPLIEEIERSVVKYGMLATPDPPLSAALHTIRTADASTGGAALPLVSTHTWGGVTFEILARPVAEFGKQVAKGHVGCTILAHQELLGQV